MVISPSETEEVVWPLLPKLFSSPRDEKDQRRMKKEEQISLLLAE